MDLKFKFREDRSVLVSCKQIPLFHVVGSDLADALRIVAIILPEMISRNHLTFGK